MAKATWESGTILGASCAHRGRVLRREGAGVVIGELDSGVRSEQQGRPAGW